MPATKAFVVTSIVKVPKTSGVRVSTIETEDTPEECAQAHGLSIAIAQPAMRAVEGTVISIERRPELEAWAADKAREALERARYDSRNPLPIPVDEPPDFQCIGCFAEHVFPGRPDMRVPHITTCSKVDKYG